MITGLLVSAIVPFLIAKFGGSLISTALIKFGVSRAAAGQLAPHLASIATKLLGGHQLTPEEQAAHAAYVQQSKPQQVPAHPGSTFRNI